MQNNQNLEGNTNLVISQNGQLFTTSLKVAEVFGKRHDSVLRDIQNLILTLEGLSQKDLHNFVEIFYNDSYGREQRSYNIKKNGLTLLVMGYTSKNAIKFKLAYIEAFDQMEKYIKETLNNQSISVIGEKSKVISFVEIEEIWNELKFLRNENENQKQFSQGLHQRMCLTEDILDKRPHAGLSFPDIPKSDFFVYFAFNPNNGLTKIGRSKIPESRVWNFQAVEPDLTLNLLINTNSQSSSIALEQLFHKIFDDKKHQRELFRLNDYDINVAGIIKNGIELAN